MSAYNFETGKIEGLKSWWAANGTTMLFAIAVLRQRWPVTGCGIITRLNRRSQAADRRAVLQQQVEKGSELVEITDAAHLLTEGFPGSGYASRAALIAPVQVRQAMIRLPETYCNGRSTVTKSLK
ncbi:MAG: hypothetical protein P0107_01165 [Nitrosomonas sp.]|nr:hypothetical protein [Nitrosomonas sp.]